MDQKKKRPPKRKPVYVDTTDGLEQMLSRVCTQRVIGLDTESNPLFAYREKLCLIQISTAAEDFIIDPLADLDVERFVPLLADSSILKVLHDAEFDVLMLKRTWPFEIQPIFDTKVAASALGRERVGLAALLEEFFSVQADKKYQRSNWGQRPLSEEQLDYAAMDTRHLLDLADELREELLQAPPQRMLEVAAECRRLQALVPEPKPFSADDFARLRGADSLVPEARRALRELFVWRHERADELDRPAFKVLGNDVLLRLAEERPATDEELKQSKILSAKIRERWGRALLGVLRKAAKKAPIPKGKPESRDELALLSDEEYGRFEALRKWRKSVADVTGTDASLLLSRGKMLELVRLNDLPEEPEALCHRGLLEDWRTRFHGAGILQALRGAKSTPRRRRF